MDDRTKSIWEWYQKSPLGKSPRIEALFEIIKERDEKIKKYEDAFRSACPEYIETGQCPNGEQCFQCPVYPNKS